MNPLPFFAFITIVSASLFPLERSLNPQPRASSADYRLPVHANPVHYEVTLEPYFNNFSFVGEVLIELEITDSANNITLHSYNLTVDDKVSLSNGSATIEATGIDYDEDYQFLTIQFDSNVTVGYYFLNISYEGYLNSDNKGFYVGSYEDSEGETRYIPYTELTLSLY